MAKLTRKPAPHKRNPPKPSANRDELEAAQVKLIEAAGQVLLDQGWRVLVAGGMKIVRHDDEPTGVHWLCLKFVGGKKPVDSEVPVLSQDNQGAKRKSAAKGRVAPARKAR